MIRVAVVYFSQEGKTAALAEAIGQGIERLARAEPILIRIAGEDIVHGRFTKRDSLDLLDSADALIFGSPTYMGGPAAQFKAFADASSEKWEAQTWRGKLAAGFTCGSNPNGDQSATLNYFSILAAQHGMLWLGLDIAGNNDAYGRNRLGTQQGVSALTPAREVDATDLATAEYLGTRVAQWALQLKRS